MSVTIVAPGTAERRSSRRPLSIGGQGASTGCSTRAADGLDRLSLEPVAARDVLAYGQFDAR
jgi:hypothetical protein